MHVSLRNKAMRDYQASVTTGQTDGHKQTPDKVTYFCINNALFGHDSFVLRDSAFIFNMSVPYDKTFPIVP